MTPLDATTSAPMCIRKLLESQACLGQAHLCSFDAFLSEPVILHLMRFEAQIGIQIYVSGQATTVDCSLYVRSLGSINPDTMVGERTQ